MPNNYYASSFFWSSLAKLLNSLINFFSIPILITFYGNDHYGILSLVMATNAYMLLLDLGLNTGAIRYFAQWHSQSKETLIDRVARTSLTFYGFVGLVNALILLILAFFGKHWFSLSDNQFSEFKTLLIILSCFTTFNWLSYVFTQLLNAVERVSFIQKIYMIKCIGDALVVAISVFCKLPLTSYYFLLLLCHVLSSIPYALYCLKLNLIKSITPAFYWKDFSIIIKYSLVIFFMGLFQGIAGKSRPLVLSIFTTEGPSVLTDYRIIEVFTIFIISIGGSLTSIFLPKVSKMIASDDQNSIKKIAYEGTSYTSIISVFLCIPIILCSNEILNVYVGPSFEHLSIWLNLWCFTIVLFLHNTPVASLVLASGKTMPLALCSAFSCITSIVVNALACKHLGVGSAVIGYLVYILIQQSFYYFYYDRKILNLKANKIFASFFLPTFMGFACMLGVDYLNINFATSKGLFIIQAITKFSIWSVLYISLLLCSRVVKVNDIKSLFSKKV